jgi:hypothetical protein
MELACFVFEVIYLEIVKHHHIMRSVVSEKALEANGAQTVFAEGLDVFFPMDLALCQVRISVADYLVLRLVAIALVLKVQIHFIVSIVRHVRS